MAIKGLSEGEFRRILEQHFTPAATIKTPDRLYGRERALRDIDRALQSQGRQIFIYGDRGVGKTSLAVTAAILHSAGDQPPIYVVCSEAGTFGTVVKAIGDAVIKIEDKFETRGNPAEVSGSAFGFGAGAKLPTPSVASIPEPTSLNEALDILRYVLAKRSGNIMVVVDEMERTSSNIEREKFAELIKNLPELDNRLRFIFCGIATTVSELIGSHPSAGRILETIELKPLHHNYLWEIIERVATETKVTVEREALVRISQISDGFPHYVHLIGESMFWSLFDDADFLSAVTEDHFRMGIAGALMRTEADLRLRYERATMKTKNKEDYEEALWALGDTTSDKRQLTEIYSQSYRRIMVERPKRPELTKEKLNQRLLALRQESHGRIVIGYGSGWFGFRENIMRGYVRLRAEHEGIRLGRDNAISTTREAALNDE